MGARGPISQAPSDLRAEIGHRKAKAALKLPPICPPMPRWGAVWPHVGDAEQVARARDLAREAAAEWRTITAELDRVGQVARADESLLRECCQAVAELAVYSRIVARDGPTLVGQKGETVRHPLLSVCAGLRSALRGYRADLGLSPAARARLHVTEPKGPDKWDDILDPFD